MTDEEYEVLSDALRSLNKTLDIIGDKQNKEKNNNSKSEEVVKGLTVKEYLLHHTKINELCAITLDGYIIATAWIDAEDLFAISENVRNMIVKTIEWGKLKVVDQFGQKVEIPCHYINC